MTNFRIEKDSMGEIKVPADRYWKAQTQRSFENFKIGCEKMPIEVVYALVQVKKAAAMANAKIGVIDNEIADAIVKACDRILNKEVDDHFPLAVWQTGSGTQTNMNVNEVISSIGNEILGKNLIHPNDHVNKGQSSNDVFPAAIHISSYMAIKEKLIPEIENIRDTFNTLEKKYDDVVKIGRTHLQDATPLTVGQEISGWKYMMIKSLKYIKESMDSLLEIPYGATAVGTGINAHKDFAKNAIQFLKEITKEDFRLAENNFHSLTSKDEFCYTHGAIKGLAMDLMKIANDVRLLASGPRSGIGELLIPQNEPGSSIMPGKVNPTQAEALTMVVAQVLGNDTTISFSASQGNFELNVYMPVIIFNMLQSINLLATAIESFNKNCCKGITINEERIYNNLHNSLMLVTALAPVIGYDKAATIAKNAADKNLTLKESAKELNLLTEEEFDKYVVPEKMVRFE